MLERNIGVKSNVAIAILLCEATTKARDGIEAHPSGNLSDDRPPSRRCTQKNFRQRAALLTFMTERNHGCILCNRPGATNQPAVKRPSNFPRETSLTVDRHGR